MYACAKAAWKIPPCSPMDPVSMAAKWVEGGCRRLHLVDLNGAFEGQPVNGEVVTAIAKRYPNLPIQIGGGIRSLETIEHYVKAGCELRDHRHQGR